jgi:hypothetical protein
MAAFLIIQECVVLALVFLLSVLWWQTREGSKAIAAESERRAEVLRRVVIAYGGSKAEVEQWRRIQLRIEHCPVRMPTPADYAAVNGSGRPPYRQQSGPWVRAVDEPLSLAQSQIRAPRVTDSTLTRRVGPFRIDYSAEWLRADHKPYGARAIVSTAFYTDGLGGTPGLGGARVLVSLDGVPARATLPDFETELGELETAGGWYFVPPFAGNKAAAAVAAAQLEMMEGTDSDH